MSNGRTCSNLVKRFDFINLNDTGAPLPEIDKAWLADAEFIRMDAVKMGTEKINFTIEEFALPSQSTATSKEIDEFDRQLKMQDRQMKQRNIEY